MSSHPLAFLPHSHTRAHTHMHTRTHMYTRTHMHTRAHTHTQLSFSSFLSGFGRGRGAEAACEHASQSLPPGGCQPREHGEGPGKAAVPAGRTLLIRTSQLSQQEQQGVGEKYKITVKNSFSLQLFFLFLLFLLLFSSLLPSPLSSPLFSSLLLSPLPSPLSSSLFSSLLLLLPSFPPGSESPGTWRCIVHRSGNSDRKLYSLLPPTL